MVTSWHSVSVASIGAGRPGACAMWVVVHAVFGQDVLQRADVGSGECIQDPTSDHVVLRGEAGGERGRASGLPGRLNRRCREPSCPIDV